jgi:hypothetical protein
LVSFHGGVNNLNTTYFLVWHITRKISVSSELAQSLHGHFPNMNFLLLPLFGALSEPFGGVTRRDKRDLSSSSPPQSSGAAPRRSQVLSPQVHIAGAAANDSGSSPRIANAC